MLEVDTNLATNQAASVVATLIVAGVSVGDPQEGLSNASDRLDET